MTVRIADGCCCAGLGADGYASIFGASALHGFDIVEQPDYPYDFTQADVMQLLCEHWILSGFDALHFSFPCQAHTTAGHLRDAQGGKSRFDDLLTPGLALLRERWGHKPWIVENVDDRSGKVRAIMAPRCPCCYCSTEPIPRVYRGATPAVDGHCRPQCDCWTADYPREHLIMLCGSMFGLEVQRHRLFLANFPLRRPTPVPNPGKSRSKYRAQGCDHSTFPIGPKGKPKPVGVYHVKGDQVPEGGHTALNEEHGRHVMGSRRLLPWDSLKEGFPPAFTSWVGADLLVELNRRGVAA